jgi:hypothetical protein
MRGESLRGALVVAGAFLLAACVGLAISVSFDTGSKPVDDALKPAEIAAGVPAVPERPRTLAVGALSALRGRPPVTPLRLAARGRPRVRHAAKQARVQVRPAPVVAPVAPRVIVQPAPAPVVVPTPAPAPAAAAAPTPAPARAPVVFDDSA